MEILAHRGCWESDSEKNSFIALTKALDLGYGVETDVRDMNGELVISHDMPIPGVAFPLEKFLKYYSNGGYTSTIGLNIKSDGLQKKLNQELMHHGIFEYFVFDMSIPDTLGYLKLGLKTLIRRSDLEHHPVLTKKAKGVWLDELDSRWISSEIIVDQATDEDTDIICIVSAELHQRDHFEQWEQINLGLRHGGLRSKLMLCTDYPSKAERFFK